MYLAGTVLLLQSDNQSDGDEGSVGAKRKGPMTDEDKKRRRQEINRQSARRIRERRLHEMERLKQQVQACSELLVSIFTRPSSCIGHLMLMILQNASLQQSQTLLLKYASTLAREKNVLVQRTLELTERWNQVQVSLSPLISGAAILYSPQVSASLCCMRCMRKYAHGSKYI